MNFRLFGFRFGRDSSETKNNTPSFVVPNNLDGAIQIEVGPLAAYNRTVCDVEGTINNEIELVNKYREMSTNGTVTRAIDEVINDMIISDQKEPPVRLVIGNNLKFSEELKSKIYNEFKVVLKLLNFNNQAYNIAKRWYIDGKLYYHVIINQENTTKGIQELRYVDPRLITKIREVQRSVEPKTRQEVIEKVAEYFLYNKFGNTTISKGVTMASALIGEKLTLDSVVFSHSGVISEDNTLVYSHLHPAIRPYNQLRAMEDGLVIHRVTRAPERRVFNIDVGDMPPAKARQYVQQIMDDFRNKMTYNPSTGELRDDRRHMTILEDFYFPKRGEQQTTVDTLQGAQNLSEIADVEYFERKLYEALFVPKSRLDSENGFNLGRAAEISREEVKFAKFIARLRNQFIRLFNEILKRQLILKKITTLKDWEHVQENLFYDFLSDSYFSELKKLEIMKERLDLLDQADSYVDKYFSQIYVKKNILMQSEDEIKQIQNEIKGAKEPEQSEEQPAGEEDTEQTPSKEPTGEEEPKTGGEMETQTPSTIEVPKPEEEK